VYVIMKVMCLCILIRCKRDRRNIVSICMIRITSHKEEDIQLQTDAEEDVRSEFEAALSKLKTGKAERKKEWGYPHCC